MQFAVLATSELLWTSQNQHPLSTTLSKAQPVTFAWKGQSMVSGLQLPKWLQPPRISIDQASVSRWLSLSVPGGLVWLAPVQQNKGHCHSVIPCLSHLDSLPQQIYIISTYSLMLARAFGRRCLAFENDCEARSFDVVSEISGSRATPTNTWLTLLPYLGAWSGPTYSGLDSSKQDRSDMHNAVVFLRQGSWINHIIKTSLWAEAWCLERLTWNARPVLSIKTKMNSKYWSMDQRLSTAPSA